MRKLTRRTFLKLATAGAGLAVIETTFSPIMRADELLKAGKSVSRTTGLPRRAIPSTCLMCPARCGILGYLEENELVKIEGNPRDPNSRGRLCAKGQAGVNIVYNPDRLLYPIRRKGARGSGSWVRISWDEALDELVSHLQAARSNKRSADVAFLGGMLEGTSGLAGRFFSALGTAKVFDEGDLYSANKRAALQMTLGVDTEIPDLERARYILNFGANPVESHPLHVPITNRLVEAQMAGAKLVTFDPRLSATAARSTEWFPLNPGSDAIVALAMANVIVQRGLTDPTFIQQWMNYRLEDLARHLSQYTLEAAERASGIHAADIERIAIEFGSHQPATTITGGGLSQQIDGVTAERAVALLNALTGSIDVPGGYGLPRRYALAEPTPAPPAPPTACPSCGNLSQFFDAVQQGGERIELLITNMANPVFTAPNGQSIAGTLKDEKLVPYHVAFDSFLTETAVLADVVLPAATYLESWGVQSMPAFDMVPYVSIMQPVVKPHGEAVAFGDSAIELAKRLGGDMAANLSFSSTEDYVRAVLAQTPDLGGSGGLDQLKRSGLWVDPKAARVNRTYMSGGFKTPSGKFEVYLPQLEARGLPALPAPSADRAESGDFTLITFQLAVHTYGRTANAMWLSEIAHDNPVWIHPGKASVLGIKSGDPVTLKSDFGSIQTTAWLTQAINPEVLAIGMGVGHWASSRVARAMKFKSVDPNTEHVWWSGKRSGSHPYPLLGNAGDPVGGGLTWSASHVTISKP